MAVLESVNPGQKRGLACRCIMQSGIRCYSHGSESRPERSESFFIIPGRSQPAAWQDSHSPGLHSVPVSVGRRDRIGH